MWRNDQVCDFHLPCVLEWPLGRSIYLAIEIHDQCNKLVDAPSNLTIHASRLSIIFFFIIIGLLLWMSKMVPYSCWCEWNYEQHILRFNEIHRRAIKWSNEIRGRQSIFLWQRKSRILQQKASHAICSTIVL